MLLGAATLATAAAQELPRPLSAGEIVDPAPKLMLNDLPDLPLPERVPGAESASSRPPADVAKLEAAVERAKKNAAFRERLCKSGVLSKLEAEQGEMTVVRLTKDLENARLEAVQREVLELRKQTPEDEPADKALADAETRLTVAGATAQEAVTKWEQAKRIAAEIRVQRERKLLALGAGSRSAVKRAEAALQSLTQAHAPNP
jgi:multidrug resistance efflux pump